MDNFLNIITIIISIVSLILMLLSLLTSIKLIKRTNKYIEKIHDFENKKIITDKNISKRRKEFEKY